MEHVFPKWFYHAEVKPEGKIIQSQGELDALGDGWEETPAAFGKKSDETTQEPASDQNQGHKDPDITETDFTKMTVVELRDALMKNGVDEKDLKGLRKDQLIAKLGAL